MSAIIILGDIEMTGTDIQSEWIYDNVSLASWYSLAPVEAKFTKRPNAHGEYDVDRLYTEGMPLTVEGQFYGTTPERADAARSQLNGLFRDGVPILMMVIDTTGAWSRRVNVTSVDSAWRPDGYFTFTIDLHAPDPRRYGLVQELSSGLPKPSTGLTWPLGGTVTSETTYALEENPEGSSLYEPTGLTESPAGSGLYLAQLEQDGFNPGLYLTKGTYVEVAPDPDGPFFDWGTVGETGQVAVTNVGNASSSPVISVGAGGIFGSGFRVTEIETGRELTYPERTAVGQVVTFMSRTQRALLNGGDVTGSMSRRQWFEIPAGESRTYQVDPLGSVAGAPTYTVAFAPANF